MGFDGPGPFENSHGKLLYGKLVEKMDAVQVGWEPIRSMLNLESNGHKDEVRCCEAYAAAAIVAIVCSPRSPNELSTEIYAYLGKVEPQGPEPSLIEEARASLVKIETDSTDSTDSSYLRDHWHEHKQLSHFVDMLRQYHNRLSP